MNEDFDLTGRVALVTGASRGLGLATARALASAGAHVVTTDIDLPATQAVVAKFLEDGLKAEAALLDVTDEPGIRSLVKDIAARHERIDILVNNAGMILRKPLVDTTGDEFRRLLNVDLVSMLLLAGAVAPVMAKNGYGRIINLSSIMGKIGRAGQATYVAAKHGVVGLTKSLAAEFGPQGITSNAVAPGYFFTEMNRQILDDQDFYQSVISRTPLRRWAEAEELGGTMVFLASKASAYLTGQTLVLDGGMTVTVPGPAGTS
ncbi:SDR family NAD(P)-dependent oxidoreductase [Mesorhizobium sp. BH1-1-4]|uniref:SDR family NAD(P)-dependent oxidoreductase n=1 Tax=Mesorhizobium sp. BH1-1-4 TaxID=2876662 RepID=UPI001CD0A0F5|nr:SDR family oxidoreductase [Mesorhizobium sp. BH1-1-4]MBZ9994331.1 SDR family oxidoreductase [Mesorhizobium sp. BH1-1-4]